MVGVCLHGEVWILNILHVELFVTNYKEETGSFEAQWKEVASLQMCPEGHWYPPSSFCFLPRGVSSFVPPYDPNRGALLSACCQNNGTN